jgi:hypothetical protein
MHEVFVEQRTAMHERDTGLDGARRFDADLDEVLGDPGDASADFADLMKDFHAMDGLADIEVKDEIFFDELRDK